MTGVPIILAKMIEKDVGSIMGFFITILAAIMNVIYNIIYTLTNGNSTLGIAIILMTFVIRLLMLPQGIATQKSQIKIRKIQPEIDKIKKKYGNSKDPEIQKKINIETQALYQKYKINPFGGCLPLLITLPIFWALIDMMRRLYIYIDKIKELYLQICDKLYDIVPGIAYEFNDMSQEWKNIYDIAKVHYPSNYRDVNITVASDFYRFIDTFTKDEWEIIKAQVTDSTKLIELDKLLDQRDKIQNFLGINLVNTVGYAWPGIIIPVLSAATSFILSYTAMKMNLNPSQDQSGKMNQMIMMVAMPVMMFFFTISVSGGVGVYWIASNVFALIQQVVLMKILLKKMNKNADEIVIKGTK